MIVITGATGHFGRQVVEGLLEEMPAAKIGVSVRDPEKAAELGERGVRVRRGDYKDPQSLREAFEGAEQVLLVSGGAQGDEGVRQHGNAIDAAKLAGAQRILYTSHQGRGTASLFGPTKQVHVPTDALLAQCGVPYVSLQNGFYAESALFQLRGVRESGKVALPQDGPVNWTARADLAAAAVRVLLQPDLLEDGLSPPLTASALLDFGQIAQLASEILGRPVTREVVSDDDYRAGLLEHGTPAIYADLLLTLYTAARAGEFAVLDPTLTRLLGREPTPMREVLEPFLRGEQKPIFQQR